MWGCAYLDAGARAPVHLLFLVHHGPRSPPLGFPLCWPLTRPCAREGFLKDCDVGRADTQPQIPSSRPICSHPGLSPIKMIQIIVFAKGCRCCCGGRRQGDPGLDLAQQDSLGRRDSQVGLNSKPEQRPHGGERGLAGPIGRARATRAARAGCGAPPVGSSEGWHQPAGGAVVICRCWGKKLDPRTTEVPPGRLAPSVSPGHASWSLALCPTAHHRP